MSVDDFKARILARMAARGTLVENPVVVQEQAPACPEQAPASADDALEDLSPDEDDAPVEYQGTALQPAYRTEAPVSTVAPEPVDKPVGSAREPGPLQRRHDAMAEARWLIEAAVSAHDGARGPTGWIVRARAWLGLKATQ